MSELFAEVAVVGGGPAGVAAACAAAEAGRRVILLDEAAAPGGQIWRHRSDTRAPRPARAWLERLAESGAMTVAGASVFDAPEPRMLSVEHAGGLLRVRCDNLVLATGARERFLPFPGWTLPNVVGAGGAQALLKAGADFAGRRVVVAGSGPLLLPVAAGLARAGARLALIAEQSPLARLLPFAARLVGSPGKLKEAVACRFRILGSRYRTGVWVRSAAGDGRLEQVELTDGRRSWREPCDVLCCAFGLVPNVELPVLLGCEIRGGAVVACDHQETTVRGVFCAGELGGIGGVEQALVTGTIAGLAAAGRSVPARLVQQRERGKRFGRRLAATFSLRPGLRNVARRDTIVCRCEDVPLGALDPAWTGRQAKLATRLGMGPCQGRVCGPACEFLFGWPPDTVRPPIKPTAIAGLIAQAEALQ
jgi:NADPH-dependent 2,4-dienoyl-CoA reductase/sulfur reductase-like enzyme